MTFVNKFLITPALGAAGLFAGYTVYRRKFPVRSSSAEPSGSTVANTSDEIRRLAEKVEELSSRVVAVEQKGLSPDWLDMINTRFTALEERVTRETERIGGIETSYRSIESSLDAIMKSIDRVRPQAETEPDPFIAAA